MKVASAWEGISQENYLTCQDSNPDIGETASCRQAPNERTIRAGTAGFTLYNGPRSIEDIFPSIYILDYFINVFSPTIDYIRLTLGTPVG